MHINFEWDEAKRLSILEPGGDWAFECLHGHVRAHLAMIGPWAVRTGWPST